MSLVSYLKALCSRFYSKNESELVGHQAMPGDSTIEYFKGDCDAEWADVHSFVAPTDGYVSCNATSTSKDSAVTIIGNQLSDNITFPWANSKIGTQVPIKKGAQVSVYASRVKGVVVGFVKTVGGGKPLIPSLQGGLLCLRNSLKRCLSSRAEWQCPQITLCQSRLQKERQVVLQDHMSLLVMAGSTFMQMWESTIATFVQYELKQKYKHVLQYRSQSRRILFGLAVMSQSVKEKPQKLWSSELAQQNRFVSFCQRLALSNLDLGGARC